MQRGRGRGRIIWPRGHTGLKALTSLILCASAVVEIQSRTEQTDGQTNKRTGNTRNAARMAA